MQTSTKKQLLRLLLEILAILGALLLGISSGCSLSWTPQRTELKFLWPDRDVSVTVKTTNAHTQPAEEP